MKWWGYLSLGMVTMMWINAERMSGPHTAIEINGLGIIKLFLAGMIWWAAWQK